MKIRTKHRKLFYVPGMISLLLLPFLCMWFIKNDRSLIQHHSIDIVISDSISETKPTDRQFYYSEGYVPKRDYKTYLFDGNNDEQKLKDLLVPLKEMVEKNDSLIGFKFSFGKHAKYQTFISAQDLLFMTKINSYIVYKNDIYAFEIPRKISKAKKIPIIKCGLVNSSTNEYWAEQERKEARQLFIKNVKHFWQIPLALLVIIAVNLYALIKFNKNRNYNQKSYI